MSEKKSNGTEKGPQGKEIFIGSTKKPASDLESRVLEDIRKDQTIDVDVVMEMTITQLENDKTLQAKYPDELKMLRQQWKEFSNNFQKLTENIK